MVIANRPFCKPTVDEYSYLEGIAAAQWRLRTSYQKSDTMRAVLTSIASHAQE